MKIIATKIKIGEFEVDPPPGISELLESMWCTEREETHYLDDYEREVIKRDGQIVTILTKNKKR